LANYASVVEANLLPHK